MASKPYKYLQFYNPNIHTEYLFILFEFKQYVSCNIKCEIYKLTSHHKYHVLNTEININVYIIIIIHTI